MQQKKNKRKQNQIMAIQTIATVAAARDGAFQKIEKTKSKNLPNRNNVTH
jgi:hypothetical protein